MGALNRRPKKPLTTIIKAHLLPSIWLVVRSKKDFVYPDTVFQFPRADIFLHPDDLEPTPELKKAIEKTTFYTPICAVYQNVVSKAVVEKDEIKKNLIDQLTSAVRWTQSIQAMIADGASHFTEIGPGKVLQGLIQKIDKAVQVDGVS